MITIEEKLNVFNKLVLGHVQLELEEKYNELNQQNNGIIEEHKKKLQLKKERIIDDYISKGNNERNKLISQANLDKKRQLLSLRQEFIDRVITELYKRAEEFCSSKDYEDFMIKTLEEILPRFEGQGSITIHMTQRDIDRFTGLFIKIAQKYDFIKDAINYEVFQDDLVGGMVVFNGSMTLKVDYSINTIIEDNRWQVGQKIYEALQELGDIDG